MKHVIVLRGVSGSGKSTLAEQLVAQYRQQGHLVGVVSADHHFTGPDGQYRFDPAGLPAAHAGCFRTFLYLLEGGCDVVIVDNTNTRAIEIAPYMAGAAAFDYQAMVITVECPIEEAWCRGLHGCSIERVASMAANLASETLPPWWHHEIYERHLPGNQATS